MRSPWAATTVTFPMKPDPNVMNGFTWSGTIPGLVSGQSYWLVPGFTEKGAGVSTVPINGTPQAATAK